MQSGLSLCTTNNFVVFCVGGCLSVLLDALVATAAIIVSLRVILRLISLEVAGMM